MKQLHWLLFFFAAVLFAACSDDVIDTTGFYFKPVENHEDRLPAELQFNSLGGSFEVMFDTGQDWTASVQDDEIGWIHIQNPEGESGINSVVITADPNNGMQSRTASVLILAQTVGKRIKITQSSKSKEQGKANRTVLAYLAAENSLSSFANEDLMEMVEGANNMPENNNLIVFVDDLKLPRIYEIGRNQKGIADTLRVMNFEEELDSTDPATLELALNFVKENYEADEYGLVMWSHGEGWVPTGVTRYIGVDNNSNSTSNVGNVMRIDQLKSAIGNSIGKLDFLFFDACFMMTAEVAYELRYSCHYMIGSPCEIPGPGAPYNLTVPAMFEEDLSRGSISKSYYDYYYEKYGHSTSSYRYGAVITTLDCTLMEPFADLTSSLVKKYQSSWSSMKDDTFIQYGFGRATFAYPRYNIYADIKSVMKVMLDESDFASWLESYEQILVSFDSTDFWYSEVQGECNLDLNAAGGMAISVFPLILSDSALEDLKTTEWYAKVWK